MQQKYVKWKVCHLTMMMYGQFKSRNRSRASLGVMQFLKRVSTLRMKWAAGTTSGTQDDQSISWGRNWTRNRNLTTCVVAPSLLSAINPTQSTNYFCLLYEFFSFPCEMRLKSIGSICMSEKNKQDWLGNRDVQSAVLQSWNYLKSLFLSSKYIRNFQWMFSWGILPDLFTLNYL